MRFFSFLICSQTSLMGGEKSRTIKTIATSRQTVSFTIIMANHAVPADRTSCLADRRVRERIACLDDFQAAREIFRHDIASCLIKHRF